MISIATKAKEFITALIIINYSHYVDIVVVSVIVLLIGTVSDNDKVIH